MAAQRQSGPKPIQGGARLTAQPWWPWFRRMASLALLLVVAGLLFFQARHIEWAKVLMALKNYPVSASWGAVLLTIVSYALYGCFDLLSRAYTGHKLGTGAVMATAAVSYGFTLNLGFLIGGVAMRLRLYSRQGLAPGDITRIISFSILTNWIGYLLLAGLVFSLQPPALPENWNIDTGRLRFVGVLLLVLAGAYLTCCALLRQRHFQLRGHAIDLPPARLAGLQMLAGAANWLVISGIVFILLQRRIEFSAVIAVLLLAAVAGVIVRIPANLGVLEAVFVALLSGRMPEHDILAALVAYRVVYYLIPLALAALTYGVLEARAKKIHPALARGSRQRPG